MATPKPKAESRPNCVRGTTHIETSDRKLATSVSPAMSTGDDDPYDSALYARPSPFPGAEFGEDVLDDMHSVPNADGHEGNRQSSGDHGQGDMNQRHEAEGPDTRDAHRDQRQQRAADVPEEKEQGYDQDDHHQGRQVYQVLDHVVALECLQNLGARDEELLGAFIFLHDIRHGKVDGDDIHGLDLVFEYQRYRSTGAVPGDQRTLIDLPRVDLGLEVCDFSFRLREGAFLDQGRYIEPRITALNVLRIQNTGYFADPFYAFEFLRDPGELFHGAGVVDIRVQHAHDGISIWLKGISVINERCNRGIIMPQHDLHSGIHLDPGYLCSEKQGYDQNEPDNPIWMIDAEIYDLLHERPYDFNQMILRSLLRGYPALLLTAGCITRCLISIPGL